MKFLFKKEKNNGLLLDKVASFVAGVLLYFQRLFVILMYKLIGKRNIKIQATLMFSLLIMALIYCLVLLFRASPTNTQLKRTHIKNEILNTLKKDSLSFLEHIYQSYSKPQYHDHNNTTHQIH
jgi:hypothetical protein